MAFQVKAKASTFHCSSTKGTREKLDSSTLFDQVPADILSEEAVFNTNIKRPTVYPYRTRLFLVYKLDFNEQKWVEMLTLGNRALFLSENQSVSVSIQSFSNCEENSIYYTDEYWDKIMDDAYSYE
ncbi:Domain unknown function DUF295 - like 10, partial [Theobroma cacao]